jgi:uncharacterized protein with PIN domain
METREKPQKISLTMDHATCTKCGKSLLDITNIKFIKDSVSSARFQEELYICRSCGTEFIIRYDLFDSDGHINQRVFTDDPNDPKYNWPDILNQSQRDEIAKHLKDCKICNGRLDDEFENNLWFSSLLHSNKEKL